MGEGYCIDLITSLTANRHGKRLLRREGGEGVWMGEGYCIDLIISLTANSHRRL